MEIQRRSDIIYRFARKVVIRLQEEGALADIDTADRIHALSLVMDKKLQESATRSYTPAVEFRELNGAIKDFFGEGVQLEHLVKAIPSVSALVRDLEKLSVAQEQEAQAQWRDITPAQRLAIELFAKEVKQEVAKAVTATRRHKPNVKSAGEDSQPDGWHDNLSLISPSNALLHQLEQRIIEACKQFQQEHGQGTGFQDFSTVAFPIESDILRPAIAGLITESNPGMEGIEVTDAINRMQLFNSHGNGREPRLEPPISNLVFDLLGLTEDGHVAGVMEQPASGESSLDMGKPIRQKLQQLWVAQELAEEAAKYFSEHISLSDSSQFDVGKPENINEFNRFLYEAGNDNEAVREVTAQIGLQKLSPVLMKIVYDAYRTYEQQR